MPDHNSRLTGMAEATRLTREGKLAEATALIQRILGGDLSPPRARTDETSVPERQPTEATFQVTVEPAQAAVEAPTRVDSGTRARASTQQGTARRSVAGRLADTVGTMHRAWAERPAASPQPKITLPIDLPLADLLGGHLGGAPVTVAVPAGGRWISGTCSNTAGTRAYKLYIPSGYRGQAVPLVVMLHGCTQTPDDFAAGTGMNALAETGGFLVVYPEQAAQANHSRCWNWFQTADQQRDRGEPSLIADITRQVMSEYRVDAGRVYMAGMSAGGAMAAILGATYPDLFAAVGVHSGLVPGCAHDLPSAFQAMKQGGKQAARAGGARLCPLILFQGDRDQTVHSRNAEDLVRHWHARTESATPVSVRQGRVEGGRAYTRAVYHDPRGEVLVEHWTIHGAGHAWSGGSRNGSYTDPSGPDASREMVRFFHEHSRASGS